MIVDCAAGGFSVAAFAASGPDAVSELARQGAPVWAVELQGARYDTGVTIFTGYPFLRGALRSLRSGRAGTDALVSAATVASLILRENVVALTVLWLLNIGEYLQDLTLRRTRRAISELLRGSQDTAWVRLADGRTGSMNHD